MQNTLPFEQLHQLFESEFTAIGKSLEELSSLYHKLPVPESAKKRFIDGALKHKSAWYACLVNSNIDVLLLPEYLESKQSRNILIKKETDQYFKSLENFNVLLGKSNTSLYECIVSSGDVVQSAVDLFSSHVTETDKCPEPLHLLFENWNISLSGYEKLESVLYGFLEWHKFNQYSFISHRHHILWLNHQLWKQFGHMSFCFNTEHYLFQNWNKDHMDATQMIGGLLHFIKLEIDKNRSELNELFKEYIDFSLLKPRQKLVSGYLFSNSFRIDLPSQVQIQLPAIKTLIKKGYIELQDLGGKTDMEKTKQTLVELLEQNIIQMVDEDEEIYISINPSYQKEVGRLSKYNNIEEIKPEVNWEAFASQSIKKVIMPKVTVKAAEAASEPVRKRQKAFFG